MAWTFTVLCILVCVSFSVVLLMTEQHAFKHQILIKGFITERKIRSNHIYFTLLSIDPTETIHFILPIKQNALVLQVGDLVQIAYDQVPFVLFKPITVRTLEILKAI